MIPPLWRTSTTFDRSRSWGFMGFILKITAILLKTLPLQAKILIIPEAFRNRFVLQDETIIIKYG